MGSAMTANWLYCDRRPGRPSRARNPAQQRPADHRHQRDLRTDPQIRASAWCVGRRQHAHATRLGRGKPYVVQATKAAARSNRRRRGWRSPRDGSIVDTARQAVCHLQLMLEAYDPKNCDKVPRSREHGVSALPARSVDNKNATTLAAAISNRAPGFRHPQSRSPEGIGLLQPSVGHDAEPRFPK